MIAYATRTGLTTDVVPEGAHPYMPYQAQGDIPTGLYLSIGIMAAYINRLRTGLGDQVSCSLYGSGMMSAMVPILSGQKPYNNLWPKGRENVLPFSACTGAARTTAGSWLPACSGMRTGRASWRAWASTPSW